MAPLLHTQRTKQFGLCAWSPCAAALPCVYVHATWHAQYSFPVDCQKKACLVGPQQHAMSLWVTLHSLSDHCLCRGADNTVQDVLGRTALDLAVGKGKLADNDLFVMLSPPDAAFSRLM